MVAAHNQLVTRHYVHFNHLGARHYVQKNCKFFCDFDIFFFDFFLVNHATRVEGDLVFCYSIGYIGCMMK